MPTSWDRCGLGWRGRADLWAAGIVLYQMLSGHPPFQGDSYNEVISKILVEEVPPLESLVPGIPHELLTVVQRALRKPRDERYQTAAHFMQDILSLRHLFEELARTPEFVSMAPTMGGEAVVTTRAVPVAAFTSESTARTAPFAAGSEGSPSSYDTALLGDVPRWKRAAWYALTLPLAWLIFIVNLKEEMFRCLFPIFGLSEHTSAAVGYVIVGLCAMALTAGAVVVERFWAGGRSSRWLHGPFFVVYPLVGLVASYRGHEVLSGQVYAALTSFRHYTAIGTEQATEINRMLGAAYAQYLHTSGLVWMLLAVLSLTVLLGYVFRTGTAEGVPRPSLFRWLLLPAGLAVVLAVHLLFLPGLTSDIGNGCFAPYPVWFVIAVSVLRERPGAPGWRPRGWGLLVPGLVAMVALSVLGTTVGHIDAFASVDQLGQQERAEFLGHTPSILVSGFLATWSVLLLLLLALGLVCHRSFAWRTGAGLTQKGASVAVPLISGVATALPFMTLTLASGLLTEGFAVPWSKPAIVEMSPVALGPGQPASCYVDKSPATLGRGAREFFAELTGKPAGEFSERELVIRLAGTEACRRILEASLSSLDEDGRYVAARCLTAIEAKVYCEARGKRLPTPEEWEAAVGSISPYASEGSVKAGALVRGPFAEGTMRVMHGTPKFELRGVGAAMGVPDKVAPDEHFRDVGFRCAFTFE